MDAIFSEDLARMKVERFTIQNQAVRVASIADLIRMKQAAGRPQDCEDVKALRRLL